LTQNGSQRAAGERSVQRHDDHPPIGMPQLRVAALRRGVGEPDRLKCSNDIPTEICGKAGLTPGCGSRSG
jgi:hypothetical protein